MRFLLALSLLVGCSDYDLQWQKDNPDTPIDTDTDNPVITGDHPDITVEPETLDFGSIPVDCPTEYEVVTITNDGSEELNIESLQMVGTGNSAFDVKGIREDLAPGESYTVKVNFTPQAWVTYDVSLQIVSNDPDEGEYDMPVTGIGAEDMIYEDRFEQALPSTVDVLWIIDNSGSMSSTVDDLQAHFPTFMANFVALDLDWQMGLVSTDMDTEGGRLSGDVFGADDPDPIGTFVSYSDAIMDHVGSASEKGMDASYAALQSPGHALSAGLVRSGGTLSVIIITDEDDSSSMKKGNYVTWLDAYKGDADKTAFSAMAGPESGMMPCTGANGISATPAPTYSYLVRNTGGFYTEICDMDFDEVLTNLSFYAAGMVTSWELTYQPSNAGQIEVYVDGVDVRYNGINGYTYDALRNEIVFHGDAIPAPEADIVVTYPVAGEC